MHVSYKGHLIHAGAKYSPAVNEWVPTLVVVWSQPWTFQEIRFTDTFSTEMIAQVYARQYGKRWIDAGKPARADANGPVSFTNGSGRTAVAHHSLDFHSTCLRKAPPEP